MLGFHRSGVDGSLLIALNVGHLQSHPVQVGQGSIRYAAPVEGRTELKVVALTSGVNISFCAGEKEPLLTDPGLDVETFFWQIVVLIK